MMINRKLLYAGMFLVTAGATNPPYPDGSAVPGIETRDERIPVTMAGPPTPGRTAGRSRHVQGVQPTRPNRHILTDVDATAAERSHPHLLAIRGVFRNHDVTRAGRVAGDRARGLLAALR